MTPLHLLFFIPFIQLGAYLFHTGKLPTDRKQIEHLSHHPWRLFHEIWSWEWHPLIVWGNGSSSCNVWFLPLFTLNQNLRSLSLRCIQCIPMVRSAKPATPKTNTAASILVVARELLDEEGLAAVAMRPIAERVGITPMAIYRHYADRASLLNAVADEGFRELATRVQTLQLRSGVEHQLMQVGDVFLEAALQFPNLYKLMFLAPREGARVYPKDFQAGRSPTFNPTVNILEEAMRAGELRPDDPIEIAFELSALSHGLIMLYLGGRVSQSKRQFRTLHQRSFRRYLSGLRP